MKVGKIKIDGVKPKARDLLGFRDKVCPSLNIARDGGNASKCVINLFLLIVRSDIWI